MPITTSSSTSNSTSSLSELCLAMYPNTDDGYWISPPNWIVDVTKKLERRVGVFGAPIHGLKSGFRKLKRVASRTVGHDTWESPDEEGTELDEIPTRSPLGHHESKRSQ
ncbi:hypothetical protein CC2G_001968 [Coprinopsis cinerea AmutBmut pab1-1]|nr:hypothetical protein CC2G_001968 [Coprinopsis cinerea AmutBmut pab1-1]